MKCFVCFSRFLLPQFLRNHYILWATSPLISHFTFVLCAYRGHYVITACNRNDWLQRYGPIERVPPSDRPRHFMFARLSVRFFQSEIRSRRKQCVALVQHEHEHTVGQKCNQFAVAVNLITENVNNSVFFPSDLCLTTNTKNYAFPNERNIFDIAFFRLTTGRPQLQSRMDRRTGRGVKRWNRKPPMTP